MSYVQQNWRGLLVLAGVIILVANLQIIVGEPLAHVIMWGIGGWQLGSWANQLGARWNDRG